MHAPRLLPLKQLLSGNVAGAKDEALREVSSHRNSLAEAMVREIATAQDQSGELELSLTSLNWLADQLDRYLVALSAVEGVASTAGLFPSPGWRGAFHPRSRHTSQALATERAVALYNLAVVKQRIGVLLSCGAPEAGVRGAPEAGVRVMGRGDVIQGCQTLQEAAGLLRTCREVSAEAAGGAVDPDISDDILRFAECVVLGQAASCCFHKAVADGRTSGPACAALAQHAADLYASAGAAAASARKPSVGASWAAQAAVHAALFEARAEMSDGQHLLEHGGAGAAVTRLSRAVLAVDGALERTKDIPHVDGGDMLRATLQRLRGEVAALASKAERENAQVYCQPVPHLPKLRAATLVRAMPPAAGRWEHKARMLPQGRLLPAHGEGSQRLSELSQSMTRPSVGSMDVGSPATPARQGHGRAPSLPSVLSGELRAGAGPSPHQRPTYPQLTPCTPDPESVRVTAPAAPGSEHHMLPQAPGASAPEDMDEDVDAASPPFVNPPLCSEHGFGTTCIDPAATAAPPRPPDPPEPRGGAALYPALPDLAASLWSSRDPAGNGMYAEIGPQGEVALLADGYPVPGGRPPPQVVQVGRADSGSGPAGAGARQGIGSKLRGVLLGRIGSGRKAGKRGWEESTSAPTLRPLPHRGTFGAFQEIRFEDITREKCLGRGAYGEVWSARWRPRPDAEEMTVAVKLMHFDMAQIMEQRGPGADDDREKELSALRNELQLLAQMDHPRIVRCYGGALHPKPFMVMELARGGSLDERLHGRHRASRALPLEQALVIVRDIAEALAYLHPGGVIHRDLKPHNILLEEDGRAKLADFGIARIRDPDATQTGMVLSKNDGTPYYMAPEVLQAGRINAKCDVYSLGIVAWECLSGERPWRSLDQVFQVVWKVCMTHERPPMPGGVPLAVRRLIEACWAPEPAERPTCAELVRQIDALLAGDAGVLRGQL
ncbi:unnamed protein product [Pedinophyceae sp. YPF-701]|nr:unnamed protein product [Pedinophyceae sp. YPF-701]